MRQLLIVHFSIMVLKFTHFLDNPALNCLRLLKHCFLKWSLHNTDVELGFHLSLFVRINLVHILAKFSSFGHTYSVIVIVGTKLSALLKSAATHHLGISNFFFVLRVTVQLIPLCVTSCDLIVWPEKSKTKPFEV